MQHRVQRHGQRARVQDVLQEVHVGRDAKQMRHLRRSGHYKPRAR